MSTTKRGFGFWKTTSIGGLLFLLPLIVLGALIGQIIPIVMMIAELLYEYLPLKTPAGIAILVLLAILILLMLCFVVGLAARHSFAERISGFFEKNITMMFPRYTIIKELMKGSLGGEDLKPAMKPVHVQFDDFGRVGFEMDRVGTDANNRQEQVAVYLPGAPDAWSGFVVYVRPDQVQRLDIEFNQCFAISERLGRDSIRLLNGPPPADPQPDSAQPDAPV